MKIFITGSNGFIGRHLKEYLFKDDKIELLTPTSSELNLLFEKDVDLYMNTNNPDFIINCANIGGDRKGKNENIVYDNLRIFFNLAKHADSVKKIINFGSGAEYSKHKSIVEVKEEESNQVIPLDEYGFYKSIVSKYIEKSSNIYNLRIFGAYGEYEDYRFKFITNAIVKNLFKLPIIINKNVYFDYIYIDDLVKMINWFIHNDSNEKIYNVTTGKKVDLVTLANLINETNDFKSEIIVLNDGLNNEYTSNNQRILKEITSFSFTSHKNAISKMREYFKNNLENLDKETIINDPYLKKIDDMWKKEK